MDPVLSTSLFGASFLAQHLVMSHLPVRRWFVGRLGQRGFQGAYSLASFVTWLPLAFVWWSHLHEGAPLWNLRTPVVTHTLEVVTAFGLGLVVAGVLQPAPSSISAAGTHGRPLEVRGVVAVTRHPMMMGIALVSAAHLLLNGWPTDAVFWGSQLLAALLGVVHQDRRHAATRPEYADLMTRTTFFPNPLALPRIGGRGAAGMALGVGLAVAIRWAHRFIWS